MNNSGKLFSDELTEWLLEVGFIQSQSHMSIYSKYAPDGTKIVILSYVDVCAYSKKFTWEIFPKLSTNHSPRASEVYQYTKSST